MLGARFAIPEEMHIYLALLLLPVGITATVGVFLLATKLYSVGPGIALGILTLIPRVGLVVLLIINAKATGVLKKHGIAVGLLGADTSTIR